MTQRSGNDSSHDRCGNANLPLMRPLAKLTFKKARSIVGDGFTRAACP